MEFAWSVFPTPWGFVGVAATGESLARIVLPRSRAARAQRELLAGLEQSAAAGEAGGSTGPILEKAREQIIGYLAGKRRDFTLPIALLAGSDFFLSVWQACRKIPYGQTRSYGWLAERIGQPAAARAVGRALGANPLPLIVPCHRVVRSDGSLGGFGGGLSLKRRLLALERDRSKPDTWPS